MILASDLPSVYYFRVKTPDGNLHLLEDCEKPTLPEACDQVQALAEELGIPEPSPWSTELSPATWEIRRELESLGVDPAGCQIEAVVVAPASTEAPNGYRRIYGMGVLRRELVA